MKHENTMLTARGIKIVLFIFSIIVVCFFSLAMRTKRLAADLWQQLGITEFQAKQDISNSFTYGELSYLGVANAKNIAVGDRVAVINELAAYTKKYIASPEFRQAYENNRKKNIPVAPDTINTSLESIKALEKERIEKMIDLNKKGENSSNEQVKKSAETRIELYKKQIKDLDDPNNRMVKARMDNAKRSNEFLLRPYKAAVQKFEENYPAVMMQLMKRRLQRILEITADVDYTADLKDSGKWKVFVNPEYEKKPKEWKLAFRSGKAATDAMRKLAEDWLKQL